MRVEEIWDRIRIRSGQFILNKTKIELDSENFRVLVEDALAEYNRSRPYDKMYKININAPFGYVFTESFDPVINQIPTDIAEATPIRATFSNPYLYGSVLNNPSHSNSELIDPLQMPWLYEKPRLSVTLTSMYKVVAIYDHKVIQITPEDGSSPYWTCPTISVNEDPWFFNLLQGMFLQGIGRSRRAFTLSDIPITMDADQLYSEGAEKETNALEQIHANKKIHLVLR